MKLLVVTPFYKPAYRYGGPVRSLSAICEGLATLGVPVTVLTTNADGPRRLEVPLRERVNVSGVEVVYFPLPPRSLGSFYFCPALGNDIQDYAAQSDVVWLSTLWEYQAIVASSVCWRLGIPYIIALHGQLLPWSIGNKALKKKLFLTLIGRKILNRAGALFCTDPTEAHAATALGLTSDTFWSSHGLNTKRFQNLPTRGTLRKRFSIPDNAAVILLCGRLHSKKRPDIALAVMAKLQNLSFPVHLLIVGADETSLLKSLFVQAERLNCLGKLHYGGLLSDNELLSAYVDSDLLIMPSEPFSENFGMSAAEAMACGIPILTTEGIPVGEIANEISAGITSPLDVVNFADRARTILQSVELQATLGNKGREYALQNFDQQYVSKKILAKCQELILQKSLGKS